MTEKILLNNKSELNTDDFIRHSEMKVRGMLEQCQRKGVQPRELLLKAFESKKITDNLTQTLYEVAFAKLSNMPDYDLSVQTDYVRAKKDIMDVITPFVEREEGNHDVPTLDMKANWVNVGVFSYEYGPDNEIILHVPPMKDNPGLHQLKDSLHSIAEVLKNNLSIIEVRGNSLLLEHPLAKRLGFIIEDSLEAGVSPNFKMSRDEFIERFGK